MVIVHTSSELNKLRESARIVALVHSELKKIIVPGITTKYLEEVAIEIIAQEKGVPAFLGYKGYPSAICTSLNNEIVHGIPSDKRVLEFGDILSVDVGAIASGGYYGDACFTVVVGGYTCKEDELLVDTSYACLKAAVSIIKDGVTTGMIGNIIERTAYYKGFDVVRNYMGHGISKELHCKPGICNFGKKSNGVRLLSNCCVCIEPMLVYRDASNHRLSDGWTVVTDNSHKAAHVEAQIIIKHDGCEVIAG